MAELAINTTQTASGGATAWGRLKTNRNWLGFWFMLPAAAFLVLFLAYPLGLGVWLSFTDARLGRAGEFIGLENYDFLRDDSVFWQSVFNTLLYTGVASIIKFAVGLYLALLLNERLPFKAIIRAVVLIPFIVPTVLSAIAFWWLYDPQFAEENASDHQQYRFPRRCVERALVGDLCQYLAWRAIRRDHPTRRPADRVALAL
jgi:multiple sugar transport system permease protein